MTNLELARAWLKQAQSYLTSAEDLYKKGRYDSCYVLAQRSGEFSVKAVYSLFFGEVIRTHSTKKLIKELSKHKFIGKEILEELSWVDDVDLPPEIVKNSGSCEISMQTGYVIEDLALAPVDFVSKEEAKRILVAAKRALSWAAGVLRDVGDSI